MKYTMKLLALLLITQPLCYGMTYKCEFVSDNPSDELKISLDKSEATVLVKFENQKHEYSKCKLEKDDVGVLIDCSAGRLDFMILLNNQVSPAAGGVMSSSLNLFTDINC